MSPVGQGRTARRSSAAAFRLKRRLVLTVAFAAAALGQPAEAARGRRAAAPRAAAPREGFETAVSALRGDRSEKVRVQAALVLGRTGHDRALDPLLWALAEDGSPAVRATAARALADLGQPDPRAETALKRAATDADPLVRRHAAEALNLLFAAPPNRDTAVLVKGMGDKSRRASPALRERMRAFVARDLAGFRGPVRGGYTVDGAIRTLTVTNRGDMVAATCSVELILSARATNGIIMMSSGEATVEQPRYRLRQMAPGALEADALENAVRGASEELRQHFAARTSR
jgi:hypothetical protein